MSRHWPFGANRPDPDRPSIFAADPSFGAPRNIKPGKTVDLSHPFLQAVKKPKQPSEGSRLTLAGSLAPRRDL